MRIGIDIGGNHISVGLINAKGKILLKRERDFIQKDKKNIENVIEEHILDTINEMQQLQDFSKIELIGICSCGLIKREEIVKASNLNIVNFKIVQLLKQYFNIPIFLRNDAKCAGIAEKVYGSLKNCSDGVFLTIGTGIGGAAFMGGKLIEPKRSSGFEFGHMVIQKDGRPCNCGNKGCYETYGSIQALKKQVSHKLNISEYMTGKELYSTIQEHQKELKEVIQEYTDYLVLGISNIINILEPEVVSLGGSFAYYQELFLNTIKEKLYLFDHEDKPKIVIAELQNDAGIIGATITN